MGLTGLKLQVSTILNLLCRNTDAILYYIKENEEVSDAGIMDKFKAGLFATCG